MKGLYEELLRLCCAHVVEHLAGRVGRVGSGRVGSRKSTLTQWLALNAARRSFGPEPADWNRCVPFGLRPRSFNAPDGLPLPRDFLPASGVPLRAAGWVAELLGGGRALVSVDGVDTCPVPTRPGAEDRERGKPSIEEGNSAELEQPNPTTPLRAGTVSRDPYPQGPCSKTA